MTPHYLILMFLELLIKPSQRQ
uniref:Predicted gene, 17490 n=1 Tax=Mus spicilegus TaxID=10103 RepID=A0A8C6I5G2_MUSSI